MSRTDLDSATLAKSLRRIAGDGSVEWVTQPIRASELLDVADLLDENDKLRELAKGYETLTETLCNEREWCDGCPFDDPEQIVCEHMRLQTCLSKLGVEADG